MVGSRRIPLVSGEIGLEDTRALVTQFVLRALGVATETLDSVFPTPAG